MRTILNEFETIYYLKQNRVLEIHHNIFAISFYPDQATNYSSSTLKALNKAISDYFLNSYTYLVKLNGKLYLKLPNRPLLDLTEDLNYSLLYSCPLITLQGRSREDSCLKIISLYQNYRWTLTHHYSND